MTAASSSACRAAAVCLVCRLDRRKLACRDHVFADFLGGKAWVGACRHCNNTFGHTIEAAALSHLKDLMFVFRRCGFPLDVRGRLPCGTISTLWTERPTCAATACVICSVRPTASLWKASAQMTSCSSPSVSNCAPKATTFPRRTPRCRAFRRRRYRSAPAPGRSL